MTCSSSQVTKFAPDHPGGDDLILNYAGKDITSIMSDENEHAHSTSAFELLQEYQVGRLGAEETITNPDFVWEDHFVPQDTDNDQDWEKNQFLDLNKPLIPQMWVSQFSKAFYLQQVHQPRSVQSSLRPSCVASRASLTLARWARSLGIFPARRT